MSVIDGQKVNEAISNAAFVSKTTDSTIISKVTLNKSGSGTTVIDAQAAINRALDVNGTTETDTLPFDYANSNFIADGDNRKVAIEKLDAQLKLTDDKANTATSDIATHETRLDNLETATMTIAGNKTFSGNVIVQGDLTVDGTTYSKNQLEVTDTNITVNKDGTNATSEGAGLTVDRVGTKGSLIYKSASPTKFAIGDLGSEKNLVDESTSQLLTNKSYEYSDYLEQGSDPSNPGTGYRRVYAKNNGFYERDSAGVITQLGGAGAGLPNFDNNELLIGTGTNIPTTLNNGTTEQTLKISGGVPTWQNDIVWTTVSSGSLVPGATTGFIRSATAATFGTVNYNQARWYKKNNVVYFEWDFKQTTAGTAGAGAVYLLDLPTVGLPSLDLNSKPNTGTGFTDYTTPIGTVQFAIGGSSMGMGYVMPYSTTQLKLGLMNMTTTTAGANTWSPSFVAFNSSVLMFSVKLTYTT